MLRLWKSKLTRHVIKSIILKEWINHKDSNYLGMCDKFYFFHPSMWSISNFQIKGPISY